jgi:hypothetical protein
MTTAAPKPLDGVKVLELGEHADTILASLGYAAETIASMRASGAI